MCFDIAIEYIWMRLLRKKVLIRFLAKTFLISVNQRKKEKEKTLCTLSLSGKRSIFKERIQFFYFFCLKYLKYFFRRFGINYLIFDMRMMTEYFGNISQNV